MDEAKRRMVEQHLAEAERHVSEGERLLEHQRSNIDERRRDGHDIELATELLEKMEDTQRLHLADRERLRQELAEGRE